MQKQLVQYKFPNMTSKEFDQCWKELKEAGYENPNGLLHHVAAPDGSNWVVVDIWESKEKFEKFGETLKPILRKVGVTEVQPKITPVYYEMSGRVHA